MPEVHTVTQHALDRYQERFGGKRVNRILARMLLNAAQAKPLKYMTDQYYHRGIIYVIRQGEVKTVFRPHSPAQMAAVFALKKSL